MTLRNKFNFSIPAVILLLVTFSNLVIADNHGLSAPIKPTIRAAAEHNLVVLYWDDSAESSIDSLTGYADFEGYRIYRSTDGGVTWGTEDDKLYDYDQNFIGWRPLAQYDLSELGDSLHCIYTAEECGASDPKRGITVAGPDPFEPARNIGENTGLTYVYVDEDVIDGREYTYSVTAFDMGLRTYTIEYNALDDSTFVMDTVWSASNPDHFAIDGSGYKSLECAIGQSESDPNFIQVVPGFYASNITFPEDNTTFFARQESTIGSSFISYILADTDQLEPVFLKFEVQADQSDEAVAGMACENPSIHIYKIDNPTDQIPTEIETAQDTTVLAQTEIDSLLDLPGSFMTGTEIFIPFYETITEPWRMSDLVSGIQVHFTNLPELNPVFAFIEEAQWTAMDSATILETFFDLRYTTVSYKNRPNFNYRIEFFGDQSGDVAQNQTPFPSNVPFRIYNTTTGRKVSLWHNDTGLGGSFQPDDGAFDWSWTNTERVTLIDTIRLEGDTADVAVRTFDLTIQFNINQLVRSTLANQGIINIENMVRTWEADNSYSEGSVALHKMMVWEAVATNVNSEPSHDFIDNNGDGVNDNPWRVVYPWSDGDEVILKPQKFLVDGDSWVADISELGRPVPVETAMLEEVEVVPNPYIVRSGFAETETDRRLRFIRLPRKCRIAIFTITGELVDDFVHEDPYDGNAWWDLRTKSGELVAPGLYIYVVESEGKEQIGKFAVVR